MSSFTISEPYKILFKDNPDLLATAEALGKGIRLPHVVEMIRNAVVERSRKEQFSHHKCADYHTVMSYPRRGLVFKCEGKGFHAHDCPNSIIEMIDPSESDIQDLPDTSLTSDDFSLNENDGKSLTLFNTGYDGKAVTVNNARYKGMLPYQPDDPATPMIECYKNSVKAQMIIDGMKLDPCLLKIPNTRFFVLREGSESPISILVQEKLNISGNKPTDKRFLSEDEYQSSKYKDASSRLGHTLIQLACLLTHPGMPTDVTWRNFPIEEDSLNSSRPKICLIDLPPGDFIDTSFTGAGRFRIGLIRCVQEEHFKNIMDIALRAGVSPRSLQEACEVRRKEIQEEQRRIEEKKLTPQGQHSDSSFSLDSMAL